MRTTRPKVGYELYVGRHDLSLIVGRSTRLLSRTNGIRDIGPDQLQSAASLPSRCAPQTEIRAATRITKNEERTIL